MSTSKAGKVTARDTTPGRATTRSEATQAGMQRARAQGKQIGRPASEVATDPAVLAFIAQERGRGNSLRFVAEALTAGGYPTPGGAERWSAATVRNIWNRIRSNANERGAA